MGTTGPARTGSAHATNPRAREPRAGKQQPGPAAREAAYVLLEDGTRFDGERCGAPGAPQRAPSGTASDAAPGAGRGAAVGEVVFTTGMSGYQESVSDPSFAGQLITFTYPHIGNYGASAIAMESARAWARAAIMREARDGGESPEAESGWLAWLAARSIPAITGVDTRALVRHIREAGAMRGGIFDAEVPEPDALAQIAAEPAMLGRDLAGEVSARERVLIGDEHELARHLARGEGSATGGEGPGGEAVPASTAASAAASAAAGGSGARSGGARGPLVAVLDTGVKASILRSLLRRGARVELHPCASSAAELLASDPDAVLLANGPGDPAALERLLGTVRALIGKRPVWGICLGHQLLCRALGLQTFKLPFGHRGANHPVKDLRTGRIAITSQNHGFAVLGPGGERTMARDEPVEWETPLGRARLSHVNLYDRTVEGIELLDAPGAGVQYHPEAGPGPHDSLDLFDRFLSSLTRAGAPAQAG